MILDKAWCRAGGDDELIRGHWRSFDIKVRWDRDLARMSIDPCTISPPSLATRYGEAVFIVSWSKSVERWRASGDRACWILAVSRNHPAEVPGSDGTRRVLRQSSN